MAAELDQPELANIALETVLHALADETRLRIVRELAGAAAPCCCGSFDVEVSKATRSHHFKTLREAGITDTKVDGTRRLITLRSEELDDRFPGLLSAVLAAS